MRRDIGDPRLADESQAIDDSRVQQRLASHQLESMIHNSKTDTVIAEIHRTRRETAERFNGNIDAIAEDAAKRLAESGRPIWQPKATNKPSTSGGN